MTKKCFNQIKEGLEELRENIPALVEDTLRRYPTIMAELKRQEDEDHTSLQERGRDDETS